jgi:hypothetical protein
MLYGNCSADILNSRPISGVNEWMDGWMDVKASEVCNMTKNSFGIYSYFFGAGCMFSLLLSLH